MPKRPKVYYKVVKSDTLKSCLTPDEFAVQYKIGEWVKAPARTKLFIFANLYDAKSWIEFGHTPNCDIYSCHVTNIGKYKWVMSIFWLNKNMRDLKKKFRSKKRLCIPYKRPTPTGTIFAGKVKLLEKIGEHP